MRSVVSRRALAGLVALGSIAALAPEAPADAAPAPVTAIVVERTGGFAGRSDTFVVDGSTDGGQKARRMAGSAAFRRLRGSYQPANSCCDRYFYRVAVSYRGGYRKTISTVQGAAAPEILWRVIAEVERVGGRSPRPA